ncbi:unnamed protein product, partial [Ectocarpus sp. 13 AM-2016]
VTANDKNVSEILQRFHHHGQSLILRNPLSRHRTHVAELITHEARDHTTTTTVTTTITSASRDIPGELPNHHGTSSNRVKRWAGTPQHGHKNRLNSEPSNAQ